MGGNMDSVMDSAVIVCVVRAPDVLPASDVSTFDVVETVVGKTNDF